MASVAHGPRIRSASVNVGIGELIYSVVVRIKMLGDVSRRCDVDDGCLSLILMSSRNLCIAVGRASVGRSLDASCCCCWTSLFLLVRPIFIFLVAVHFGGGSHAPGSRPSTLLPRGLSSKCHPVFNSERVDLERPTDGQFIHNRARNRRRQLT